MEGHFAAFRGTNLCQNSATQAPQDVETDVPKEEEIEDDLDM